MLFAQYTRKNAQVVTSLQTSCNKSVHKLSTTLLVPDLLQQVRNKLLTTCNKLMAVSDLLQVVKSDTVMIQQDVTRLTRQSCSNIVIS